MDGSGNCDPLCSVDDVSSQDFEASFQPKADLLKALAILAAALAGAVAINHSWGLLTRMLALVFALGYAGIIFEESLLAFNKSGVGFLMAVCLWDIRSIGLGCCQNLKEFANYLDAHIPNVQVIASAIGVVSAIIDNVPWLQQQWECTTWLLFPKILSFGSLLLFALALVVLCSFGSAAGVAFMGMEKVDFFWYFHKVTGFAFAAYAAGIVAYLAAENLHLSLTT